jgi:hypothetical protein
MAKHTAESLTQEFWARRRAGELSVRLSVKQVTWLRGLLHDLDRRMPYTHTYVLPSAGVPLALVIYPNGAGFLKVEDFACEYVNGKWRVKPQYAETE